MEIPSQFRLLNTHNSNHGVQKRLLAIAVAVLGVHNLPSAAGQQINYQDTESARAFLVKLRAGTVATRVAADDGWQMIPLVSETQTRGEPTAAGNWWYLAPTRQAKTRQRSEGDTDWDAAYDLYEHGTGSATRGAPEDSVFSKREIDPAQVELLSPTLGSTHPRQDQHDSVATYRPAQTKS